MMHGTATRDYKRGDGYQAVLLPYADSPLAMAIVLPDGPLAGLEPDISGLLDGMSRRQVVLALPRFRLETGFGLIPPLERLGITSAFTGGADFTGITTEEQVYIGAVAHKAFIDVDEHGTEAAAATALTMTASALMRPPPRVEMTVDRPFGFAIIDTGSGEPLFLGQLTTPGPKTPPGPETPPAPRTLPGN
jgi:serpin B